MLKKIFSALGMGFLLAVFYLLLSLGGRQEKAPVQQIPASPLPSIGSVSSASLPDLAAVFGAQVPFVSLSGSGAVQDAQAGARLLTWQEDSGLTITGRKMLTGGTVDPQRDHRIAMAAATAACGCTAPVTVHDCACTDKSYPRFWTDLSALKTVPAAENTELE